MLFDKLKDDNTKSQVVTFHIEARLIHQSAFIAAVSNTYFAIINIAEQTKAKI
jgi:hypothetical protein